MTRFAWIASRVAAAVSGALMVGLIAGVILTVVWAATCGPECVTTSFDAHGRTTCLEYGSTCGDFLGGLLLYAIWATVYGLLLGTLPGIAALTLTPARNRPWRSLLILVPASVIGFAVWLLLADILHINYGAAWLITLFLLPTISGLIAASSIGRLPRHLGLV